MKFLFACLAALMLTTAARAQNAEVDSLRSLLVTERNDTARAILLYNLSYDYQKYKPDSALLLAQEAWKLSERAHCARGTINALGQLGAAFNRLGNFSKALETYLRQLRIVEAGSDPERIASCYLDIALVYNSQHDAASALGYAYRADSIARAARIDNLLLFTNLNIGDIYFNAGHLDSAGRYTREAYALARLLHDDLIAATALNNLGNIAYRLDLFIDARARYHEARPELERLRDYYSLTECLLGLARSSDQLRLHDSALAYAGRSFRIATENGFLKQAVEASAYLAGLFAGHDQSDSAYTYQHHYSLLKDSFDNTEKVRQLQSLTIAEDLRQQQLASQREEEHRAENERLQLFLIAGFIPVLFLVTVYISRSKVSVKAIRFSGVFSLLFLFEFITLLLHPVVQRGAHHSPVIEILVFVAIAAGISPLHHRIEHWLVGQLAQRHERQKARQEQQEALRIQAMAEKENAEKPVSP
jgi:tetratricopeptide (TPR) repeat protein